VRKLGEPGRYDPVYLLEVGESHAIMVDDLDGETPEQLQQRTTAVIHAWRKRRGIYNTPQDRKFRTERSFMFVTVTRVK
jgi:hypothetical protein